MAEPNYGVLAKNPAYRLIDYARRPIPVTPVKSEALLRLLICDLVGEEVTRESMATLRDDIADLHEQLVDDVEREFAVPQEMSTPANSRLGAAPERRR
jgi:hypothetical protein